MLVTNCKRRDFTEIVCETGCRLDRILWWALVSVELNGRVLGYRIVRLLVFGKNTTKQKLINRMKACAILTPYVGWSPLGGAAVGVSPLVQCVQCAWNK
jgi:hypothetical protein